MASRPNLIFDRLEVELIRRQVLMARDGTGELETILSAQRTNLSERLGAAHARQKEIANESDHVLLHLYLYPQRASAHTVGAELLQEGAPAGLHPAKILTL